jgi:hypothetical protein
MARPFFEPKPEIANRVSEDKTSTSNPLTAWYRWLRKSFCFRPWCSIESIFSPSIQLPKTFSGVLSSSRKLRAIPVFWIRKKRFVEMK